MTITVIAGHSSRCGLCDEIIEEGDEIVVVNGEWVHVTPCYEGEQEAREQNDDRPL